MASLDDDIYNPQVARLRARLTAAGVDLATVSNKDLLLRMAEESRATGGTDAIEDKYGAGFANQYFDTINKPEPGREGILGGLKEIPEGLGRGYEGLKSTGLGALGLGAGALGFEGAEESLMQSAAEAQQRASQYNPSIGRASDVRWTNIDEVARFLSGGFGEALPSTVEAAGSFALGAGAGGLAARTAIKSRLKDTIGNLVKNGAGESAEIAIKRTFKKAGMNLGLGVSSIGLGVGEIYTELYPYTKVSPDNEDFIDPKKAKEIAIGFGTLAGSLDMFSAALQLNKVLNIGEEASSRYLKRLLYNLPEGVFVEAATESAQEFLNIAAQKYARGREMSFTGDELDRMFDAGVLGAIGGAQFASAGAVRFGNKDKDSDLGENQSDADLTVDESIPDDFKMADDIDQMLEDIEESDVEEVKFTPGDTVALFRDGQKISGEVSSINETTAMVDSKVTVNGQEVTTRVEVDLATEGLFSDTFVPEEEDIIDEVDEEDDIVEETQPVLEEFSRNDNTIKIKPQERDDLQNAIKAYESSAQKANGVSSASTSPVKDYQSITGNKGRKVYDQLKELGVLDQKGNYTEKTERDSKIEQAQGKQQIKDNKAVVTRLFGKSNADGTRVNTPDPIGQKVRINKSSEPYVVTGYNTETGVMTAEQAAVKNKKITSEPITIDANGAFDASNKRRGRVTKYTKRGKIGGKKTPYLAYQSADNPDIFFSGPSPEGGYTEGLGGMHETDEQKSILLQNPRIYDAKGAQTTEEEMYIAQRNMASDNDGVIFENVGPDKKTIIVSRSTDNVFTPKEQAQKKEMENLGYSEAEIDEVFTISGILGEDNDIRSKIASIVGNHQYVDGTPFIGNQINRDQLKEDAGSELLEKYDNNAIRWAWENSKPTFTGKPLTPASEVKTNNLGATADFDFDPDAKYEFLSGTNYAPIDASTPEEFAEELFRRKTKGKAKRIYKNRTQSDGGFYEFKTLNPNQSFEIGGVVFEKPEPDSAAIYAPLFENTLESKEITIHKVTNRTSPNVGTGQEDRVLVILEADESTNGLEEGTIRIAQIRKDGKFLDSTKRNKDGSEPIERNRYAKIDGSGFSIIGQIELFTKSSNIDLMYSTIGEFLADPEVNAVTRYTDESEFIPTQEIPTALGGRGVRLNEAFAAKLQIERLSEEKPNNYKSRIKTLDDVVKKLSKEDVIVKDDEDGYLAGLLESRNIDFQETRNIITVDIADIAQVWSDLSSGLRAKITKILNKGEGSRESTFFTDLLENVTSFEAKREIKDLNKKFGDVEPQKLYNALKNSLKLSDVISNYGQIHKQLSGFVARSSDSLRLKGGINDEMMDVINSFNQIRSDLGMEPVEDIEAHALKSIELINKSPERIKLDELIKEESIKAYRELVKEGVIVAYATEKKTAIEWNKFPEGSPEAKDWDHYLQKNQKIKGRKENSFAIPAYDSLPRETLQNNISKAFKAVIEIAEVSENVAAKNKINSKVSGILRSIDSGTSNAEQFKELLVFYIQDIFGGGAFSGINNQNDLFSIILDEEVESSNYTSPKEYINRMMSEVFGSDDMMDWMDDQKYTNQLRDDYITKVKEKLYLAYGVPQEGEKIYFVKPKKRPRLKQDREGSERYVIARNPTEARTVWELQTGKNYSEPSPRIQELKDEIKELESQKDKPDQTYLRPLSQLEFDTIPGPKKTVTEFKKGDIIVASNRQVFEVSGEKDGKTHTFLTERSHFELKNNPEFPYINVSYSNEYKGFKLLDESALQSIPSTTLNAQIAELQKELNSLRLSSEQSKIELTAKAESKKTSIYKDGAELLANNLSGMLNGNNPVPYPLDLKDSRTLPSMGKMPKGFVSFWTGKEAENPITPLNEEDIEMDRKRRRNYPAVALPRSHPMEIAGMYEQLGQARLAMQRFTQSQYADVQFPALEAIGKVLRTDKANKATKTWARAIQANPSLVKGMSVKFVNWENFRKYASVVDDHISTAVYVPSRNQILVSDLFYDNTDITPDEQLAGVVVHEIIHGPTKLALDIGYAHANGHELPGKMDTVGAETLGRIFTNLNDVVLPELREKISDTDYVHGLSSTDEFFSELSMNPNFRKELSSISFSNETRKKLGISNSWIRNAWDYVKAIFARIFGLEGNTETLKWASEQLDIILEKSQQLTPHRRAINGANIRGVGNLNMLGGAKAMTKLGTIDQSFDWSDGTQRVLINPANLKINQGAIYINGELKNLDTSLSEDGNSAAQSVPLDSVVDLPELFEAYPELRALKVEFNDVRTAYQKGTGTIHLNVMDHPLAKSTADENGKRSYEVTRENYDKLTMSDDVILEDSISVLIHEIQHAIDEIEGHPQGANSDIFDESMRDLGTKGKAETVGEYLGNLSMFAEYLEILNAGNKSRDDSKIRRLVSSLYAIGESNNSALPGSLYLYLTKSGETTSRTSQAIFKSIASGNLLQEIRDYRSQIKDGYRAVNPIKNFRPKPGSTWHLPRVEEIDSMVSALRRLKDDSGYEKLYPTGRLTDPNFSALDEFISQLERMKLEQNKSLFNTDQMAHKEVPTPDASDRVFQEGDVAAINEVISVLSSSYNHLLSKGLIKMTPEEFIKKYSPGKITSKKFYKTASKGIDKPQNLRIGDQGKNQVTRTHATNEAINYISMMLRGRNQKNSGILDYLDQADMQIADIEEKIETFNELFKDVAASGLASPEDVAKTMLSTMKKLTMEEIKDIAREVGRPINKSAMTLDGVKVSNMRFVLDRLIVDPTEIEDLGEQGMNDAIEALDYDLFSGQSPEAKYRRMALIKVIKSQKDTSMFLYRMSLDKLGQGTSSERNKLVRDIKALLGAKNLNELGKTKYESIFKKRLDTLRSKRERQFEMRELFEDKFKEKEMLKEFHKVVNPRYKRLRASMGELEPTDIGDGETITVVRLNRDGEGKPTGGYTKKPMVLKYDKNGAIENADFDRAISETLHFVRDSKNIKRYGNQPWFRNVARTAEVALMDPSGGVKDKYFTQRKHWHLGSLESVGQAMGRMGPYGKRIAGLITQTIGKTRDLSSKVKAYAIAANKGFIRAHKELGLNGSSLYAEVWQDIAFWFDNHPEFYGKEDQAFAEMWKWIREQRPMHLENVKDMNKARDAVRFWVTKEMEAKNYMRYINEEVLGNRIRDDQVTVQSEIDGSQVDFYRRPIDLGFSTWSRTLNNQAISSVVLMMRRTLKEDANSDVNRVKILDQLVASAEAQDRGEVEKFLDALYGDEQVVKEFVEPFILGGVRRSAFKGPDGASIGNSQFAYSWERRGDGGMIAFLDDIFDRFADTDNLLPEDIELARFKWYESFTKQLNSRYKRLVKADAQVAQQSHDVLKASEAMKNTPRSLDSRQIESKLPKKFFYYDIHDEVSTQIRLAMMVATSTFGRNGVHVNNLGQGFYDKMGGRAATFNDIMRQATGGVHDAPKMSYSGSERKKAYQILTEQYKESDAKLAFERYYSDAVTYREFSKVFDQLGQYYGKGNISGAYGDANVLLELLGTQSLMVLDNPKSSFWQTLALGEFPMAFRGLNRMSGKATGAALANLFDQSFGGIVEAMHYNLPKTSRIARSLNNTHFRTAEMELSLKDNLAMVGPNGEMVDGNKTNSFKKGLRVVKNMIAHSRQRNPNSTRSGFDALTPLTGIFPWANGVINHSVGVGTAVAYEAEILRIAEHINDKGLDVFDPVEFTAQELGMNDSKTAEMIIGERDGWNNMNSLLLENGTSSMSRLAYDYVQRRLVDQDAPVLRHETILMMNQVGMSNVSGEGFNAKIPALYNNGFMRYAGIFLGWPIWKMAQTNRFIEREAGDELGTYMAFLKYMGLVSAVYMPLGLSAAFLVDWYDEEIVGKPNNLPPLTPWAMLPVIGPVFALSNEESTIYALTSRLARAGNVYGAGFEIANSMFATGDPFGAAKEFSLDSRLFMFNTFRNIRDALGTWYHQGEADYGNVIRPMLYGLGLGSVIQHMDITTNLLGIDSEERRIADYLSAKNLIKKSAWVMGLPLTPPAKGYGKPSPVSVNLRQMERAAYANDKTEFFKQYKEAVIAAKVYIEENGLDTEPESYVHNRFRQRNIRYGITKGRISDSDWQRILEIQDADDRVMLQEYMELHDFYLNQIGTTKQTSGPSMSQLRRMALMGIPIYQ